MPSKAATVAQYLAELPEDRRKALEEVRAVIRKNLDKDYEEGMQYGMIGYYVPHSVYPNGYHCDPRQPLPFACLASQKSGMSLHLMALYMNPGDHQWFVTAWKKTGKKLDMGKACVRFKKIEDLALDLIGEAIKRATAKDYIARYEANLNRSSKSSSTPKKKAPAKAGAVKKSAKKSTTKKVPKKTGVKKKASTVRRKST